MSLQLFPLNLQLRIVHIFLLQLARFPPLEKTEDFTQAVVNVDTELR